MAVMDRYLKIEWTKDRVLQIIEYWKQCECLYNPQHKLYSHKNSRQIALEKITEQLRGSMPEITTNDVKTKINYLRSQYCREMHKLKESNKIDAESDDTSGSWPYWFDSMSFLKEFVKIRSYPGKRERPDDSLFLSRDSIEDTSFADMPIPIKRSRSRETSPSSPEQSDTGVYLYKPDPDILDLLQKQIAATSSSQSTTSSQASTSSLPIISSVHTTSVLPPTSVPSTTSSNSEYDETFMSFIRVNLALITDVSLKDELTDKMTMLLLEYKAKQRKFDSRKE